MMKITGVLVDKLVQHPEVYGPQVHSYQGDFLEIALQNLTKIPDVACCVKANEILVLIEISHNLHNLT